MDAPLDMPAVYGLFCLPLHPSRPGLYLSVNTRQPEAVRASGGGSSKLQIRTAPGIAVAGLPPSMIEGKRKPATMRLHRRGTATLEVVRLRRSCCGPLLLVNRFCRCGEEKFVDFATGHRESELWILSYRVNTFFRMWTSTSDRLLSGDISCKGICKKSDKSLSTRAYGCRRAYEKTTPAYTYAMERPFKVISRDASALFISSGVMIANSDAVNVESVFIMRQGVNNSNRKVPRTAKTNRKREL